MKFIRKDPCFRGEKKEKETKKEGPTTIHTTKFKSTKMPLLLLCYKKDGTLRGRQKCFIVLAPN